MCILVRTAGPNKVIVVSGVGYSQPKFQKGGRVFQIPCIHQVSKLRINVMTIQLTSVDVNCENGVPVTIEGVVQTKLNADTDETLALACTHFLDMKEREIINILSETLEGHQRGVISTMSVEQIFQDRVKFSQMVRESVQQDLMKMGAQIVSYTISSVRTSNGYLAALGEPQIAIVQRDARIAEAQAKRDSDIEKAKAIEQRDQVVFRTKEEITRKQNERDMQIQSNQKEINTEVAIAKNAERLKTAELDKILVKEKMQIELIEKRGEAKVMDEQLKLTEQKLTCEMKLNAETERYTKIKLAEARRTEKILQNEAQALEVEQIGEAEAEAIRLKSQAEARALTLKAKAYEQYRKLKILLPSEKLTVLIFEFISSFFSWQSCTCWRSHQNYAKNRC